MYTQLDKESRAEPIIHRYIEQYWGTNGRLIMCVERAKELQPV